MVSLPKEWFAIMAPGSLSPIELLLFAAASELYHSDIEWLELSSDTQEAVKLIKELGWIRC